MILMNAYSSTIKIDKLLTSRDRLLRVSIGIVLLKNDKKGMLQ